MATTNFLTKTGDNNNIDVYLHGIELWLTRYKNKWIGREVDTINSEAQIEWEFYFDLRTWGVKEIGVTAKKIELQVDIDCFVGKSENNNTEQISFDLTEDIKDFKITTHNYPVSSYESKNSFMIESVDVDFTSQTITVYF
jgi:hypothetical protein